MSPAEIRFLLRLAAELKAVKSAGVETQQLKSKNIALIFAKNSTRTRTGFEVAAYDQGAHVTYLGPSALLPLFAAGHQLVITHGNGPQVGLLALQAAAGPKDGAYPLDVLDAESEGGRLPDRAGARQRAAGRPPGCNPAHAGPCRPARSRLSSPDKADRTHLRPGRGHAAGRDAGMDNDTPRQRLAPCCRLTSATPGSGVIELLASQGVTVICAGGGGIPVIERSDGALLGVEDVVDKDLPSAQLARQLTADHLILLTDVDGVYLDWGSASARLIKSAGRSALNPTDFRSGIHGPQD